jgi:hypothetical protein
MISPVPVKVIERINETVKLDYSHLTISQQQRLQKSLIELWLFIYNRQDSKPTEHEDFYVSIHTNDLLGFTFKSNGKVIQYSSLLLILSSSYLIDINEVYSTGRFTKSYRVNRDFIDCLTQDIEIDFKKVFKGSKDKSFWTNLYPNHADLIEETYKSSIDLQNYFIWIDAHQGEFLHSFCTKAKSFYVEGREYYSKGKKVDTYLTKEKSYQLKIQAIKFNLQNFWFKVSNEGRFYSTVSNMDTIAVPFLLINGNKTTNLDAKNSQPLLLSSIIKNNQFKKDVTSGIFYDKVAESIGIERDEFKVLSYQYIFFNESRINKTWSANIDTVYPGLSEEINNIKETRLLWKFLQELESSIWVSTAKELTFVKLLRHDQIICEEKHVQETIEALNAKYKEHNLKVNLKIGK